MGEIGFIGVGNMGAPMAQNLIKAGHSVTGFDTAAAPEGIPMAASAPEAAQDADVVITMLPNGAILRSVANLVIPAMKPGAVLLAMGLVLTMALSAGPVTVSGVTFSLNTMWLGATMSIIGLQSIFLGCMAETLYDPTGNARRRWLKTFAYTPTIIAAGLLFLVGLALGANFAAAYSGAGFIVFAGNINTNHLAVIGLVAMVLSFLTFVSTLLLHAIAAYTQDR